MDSDKRRIGVMLYDRFTQRISEMAEAAKMTPNELVNRFIEGCIAQVDQMNKPRDPIPMASVMRTVLKRNLSQGDRLLQKFLDAKVPNWKDQKDEWKDLYVGLVQAFEGDLTDKVLERLKKQADKLVRDERPALNRRTTSVPLLDA